MKTYKTIITFNNNNDVIIKKYSIKEVKKTKIENLVFSDFDKATIHRIFVVLWNKNTKKHYRSLTYDSYLDQLCDFRNTRVNIEYNSGDTERCYIGRSTGWIPCYLVIKNRNSSGGFALCNDLIKHISIVR